MSSDVELGIVMHYVKCFIQVHPVLRYFIFSALLAIYIFTFPLSGRLSWPIRKKNYVFSKVGYNVGLLKDI